MLEDRLKEYEKVKTGQDLIDLGVIPKTSSSHMALITKKRLESLRDRVLAQVNEEILGAWLPLFKSYDFDMAGDEIVDPEVILRFAEAGMRVRGRKAYGEVNIEGIEGKILKKVADKDDKSQFYFGIEFDSKIHNARNKSLEEAKPGQGYFVNPLDKNTPEAIALLDPDGKIRKSIQAQYRLREAAVADEQLGHKIKLTEDYEDASTKLPKGTVGTMTSFDERKKTITLKTEELVEGMGNRKNFEISLSKDFYKNLEVSSLGQMVPMEREDTVKKQVLLDFFPRTSLPYETAEDIVLGLLLGKDMILFGPPGSGKTNCANDIIYLAQQQLVIPIVEGCKVQCNPFSLFDPAFSKVLSACAQCKLNHDPRFRDTGFFKLQKPDDVKVVIAKYGEGKGIESKEGTADMRRYHLAGSKIPKLDGKTDEKRENEFDPEGYSPGVLPRTNNGILQIDEADEISLPTRKGVLETLNSNIVKPDQLRFSMPAHNLIIYTTNDITKFSPAENDRMIFIPVFYSDDPDVSYSVTRKSFHQEYAEIEDAPIGDTHKEAAFNLREITMPVIVERAVDALYIKFRQDYQGKGKSEIAQSNRSKNDALFAARARLLLDKVFFEKAATIANASYAVQGIQFAMYTRLQENAPQNYSEARQEISDWISSAFSEVLKEEEDTWWCKAYKDVGIAERQIPGMEKNFVAEIKSYEEDESKAERNVLGHFKAVKKAYDNREDRDLQKARFDYPFMDYLFKEQPGFSKVSKDELLDLMWYLLEAREHSSCKIGNNP
ncbi:hypothetical protein HZA97_08280 [Candidatus Woesearchaeota archaeon]|nr:hypothetical protein [Candidatus Woesearchaeota archaeon]